MKTFLFALIFILSLFFSLTGARAYPSFTKPRLLQETTQTSGDIAFPANSFTIEDYFEVYYEFAPEGNITIAIKFNAGDQFFALGLGTQMMGADIWVFQIENSELVAGDYLGVGHQTPTLDTSNGGANNLEVLGYEIAADYTIVKFTRARDTGDSNDVAISPGTTNFIWATASGSPTLGYHRSNRGTLQVDLVETITVTESESTTEEASSTSETEGEATEESTELWEFCDEEGEYISENETEIEIVVSEENLLLDL